MSTIGETNLIDQSKVKPLIFWFIGLTALFSIPIQWFVVHMGSAYLYGMTSMWTPGLAALAACRIMKLDFSVLGFGWGKNKVMLMCYLLPLAYFSVIYLITWVGGYGDFFNSEYMNKWGDRLGLDGWSDVQVALFALPVAAIFFLPLQMASATGEEIGWRGLLAPQLMRLMNFPMASLTSGVIWFCWHIPIIFIGTYMADQRTEGWQIGVYAIMLISMSFPMMYYRLKTGSLWTGAIIHASHNLFLYYIFLRLTDSSKMTKYYAGEWGMITATVLPIVALIYWYKAHKEGLTGRIVSE